MSTTSEPTPTAESAAGPAVATPPQTPFAAAAKVVKHVQLAGVHFSAYSAQALQAPEAIPENGFSASTSFLRPTVSAHEDGFSTKTTLLFQAGGKASESDGSTAKPYAVARATIEARYTLADGAPDFSPEELQDYALCYAPFHVWGYWREFVQSSLARLDLPQLTIPLFLIAHAPHMVQDKLD